ncbi:uncharacterized protein LOC110844643 isoform X2 [Folsomia candida]|uniref:Male-enhanced antigen 1 n=1 Tax=Folsomia candida TaxID=158441 RepID=A0A226EUE0_FOLCA|nr:uncharacterized protein LOC110844643 isoform X2 [Folsomia candida]OXA61139.1 Male-enhanced antigen 1 [Folsomia candida]
MMSPDPPKGDRTSSESDNLPLPDGTFVAVWDDQDDIFGDDGGPYELDIGSSGDESEFSDSGDEQHGQIRRQDNTRPLQNDQPENGNLDDEDTIQTGARGHYQLLIPFPPSTTELVLQEQDGPRNEGDDNNTAPSEMYNLSISSSLTNADDDESRNLATHSIPPSSLADANDEIPISRHQPQQKNEAHRDINLTAENVQVIKSIMTNFSLPSAAVPAWASELSDEVLKHKLSECINEKVGKSDSD